MFLICGEALFDVFQDPVEVSDGTVAALRAVAGGSPFNVAMGLARLGRSVALSTEISSDRLGQRLKANLEREGVDLAFIRPSDGATALALVDLDPAGIPHYGFHGLHEMSLHPEPAVYAAHRARIAGIHVGSFPIVSNKSAAPLLELVTGAGDKIVSLDPNIRLAVQPDAGLWRSQLERFRVQAHLIKSSVEDLEALHGTGIDAEAIAQSWLGGRTRIVVLTHGERGGVLFAPGKVRIEIPAVPTQVVDTVGAGDTYQAALLCWLDEAGLARPEALSSLGTAQLREMAEFASHAAALTCSRRGPDLPRRGELRKFDARLREVLPPQPVAVRA